MEKVAQNPRMPKMRPLSPKPERKPKASKAKASEETKVSTKAGKVNITIPLKKFVEEHETLVDVLREDVPKKIIAQAEEQAKELSDVIGKVKKIKGKAPKVNMETQTMGGGMNAETFKPAPKTTMLDEKILNQLRQVETETNARNDLRRTEAIKRAQERAPPMPQVNFPKPIDVDNIPFIPPPPPDIRTLRKTKEEMDEDAEGREEYMKKLDAEAERAKKQIEREEEVEEKLRKMREKVKGEQVKKIEIPPMLKKPISAMAPKLSEIQKEKPKFNLELAPGVKEIKEDLEKPLDEIKKNLERGKYTIEQLKTITGLIGGVDRPSLLKTKADYAKQIYSKLLQKIKK